MRREWKIAVEAVAAASGIGFSSGRTIALFFSQTGWASWIGIAAASVLFGLFCVFCADLPVKRFGYLRFILTAVTGLLMLARIGKLTALALPVRHAYWMGMLIALMISLLLNVRRMRGFSAFGVTALAVCTLFYAGLSLDSHPVRFYQKFETVLRLNGSVPAAFVLAVLYAALCAVISVESVRRQSVEPVRKVGMAVRCGMLMLAMLAVGNAAVMRGGQKLLSMQEPVAVLAARWGSFGFCASIFSMALTATATLCACIGALMRVNEKYDRNPC